MENSGDAEFARLLESIRAKGGLPAVFGAVIINGEIYATAAIGTRKIGTENWVTVDDKFLIGSCGKAFSATLAGILVEEGLLEWHITLKDVFPDIIMLPEYELITLEQLLSHRAGLPKNFIADLAENRPATPEGGRLQYVEQIVKTKLNNPPGQVMHYSNAGYVIAGAMMEKITAKTFEDLMSEKIYNPLKITDAGWAAPAELEPDTQPWGHVVELWSYKAVRKDHNYWLDPAGGNCMTIRDWAKFILQNMYVDPTNRQNIISRITKKKLHTPPNTIPWKYDDQYFKTWEKLIGWPLTSANYALGWYDLKTKEGEKVLHHGGATKSFIADVYVSPNYGNGILLATNARTSHIPLYEGAKRINANYSLKLSLP
jgi:CubicO group peptidase (beta-lactamase class C family)